MPFFFTPEQKQSAFRLALWLAVALLSYPLGPVLPPFIAAAILAYMLVGYRHVRTHYLRGSFYNA